MEYQKISNPSCRPYSLKPLPNAGNNGRDRVKHGAEPYIWNEDGKTYHFKATQDLKIAVEGGDYPELLNPFPDDDGYPQALNPFSDEEECYPEHLNPFREEDEHGDFVVQEPKIQHDKNKNEKKNEETIFGEFLSSNHIDIKSEIIPPS